MPAAAESEGARALLAGEDPALGATVPELGDAPGRDLAGKPIRRVEVVTVGGRWASSVTVTSVHAGDPASGEAARRALREVLGTGAFARANVEAFAEGGGVVLRINALPRRLIAAIQIQGGSLDAAETQEAAQIAVGGEISAPVLHEVEVRVARFYEAHGFPSARVHVDAVDTDRANNVILSIEIRPGRPRLVADRVFVVDPLPGREVGDLKNDYKVGKGARADETALADADHDLTEALKQHGFFRAEVRHALSNVGPYSYLYVYLYPGPRLIPVFEGNHAFDAGDLREALDLEKGPDARRGELTDRLRAFYVARGYLDARISMEEKGKLDDPVHYFAFTIREGAQVRVTRRVFPCFVGSDLTPDDVGGEIDSFLEEDLPGAETLNPVDPRQIARMFGPTQGTGGRGVPPPLNPLQTYAPDSYDRAVKHLRELFHSKGYLNAVVGPVSVVRATCAPRTQPGVCVPVRPREKLEARCAKDSLGLPVPEPPVPEEHACTPDPARGVECAREITVRIPIALGPQTTAYDLAFDGNKAISSGELARSAEIPLGAPLSTVELDAARQRVVDAYRLRGYAYAEVRALTEPAPDRTRARVRFSITEREQVMVTGFVVKGAARTSESLVLRRVALKRGEPFRLDWARQTEERIATLGTFSSVSVGLEDAEVPERRKRVVITVVESLPQSLEQRGGFSTGDGARYTLEWQHKNLGGLAIALTLRVQLSYLFDFLILDPTVLQNYDKLSALERLQRRVTVNVVFPEIGLGPLVSLSLDAIDARDNERDYALEKDAIVPTITWRPMRQLTTQLGLSAEYNRVTVFDEQGGTSDNLGLIRAPQGKTLAVAQRISFTYDMRDNPVNATKGFLVTTGTEHVNAFPVEDANVTSHFLRLTARLAGYLRLTQGGITLAASLAGGYNLQLFGQSSTYPDRLFFMGGVDSLRSFLQDAVVPQDVAELILKGTKNPNTGRPWSVNDVLLRGGDVVVNPRFELRVPLKDPFLTALFLDTGNVWVKPGNVDITSLRYALGAGLRIATPIGPLAFDYGFNLIRRPWEDVGAFHFSIGLF